MMQTQVSMIGTQRTVDLVSNLESVDETPCVHCFSVFRMIGGLVSTYISVIIVFIDRQLAVCCIYIVYVLRLGLSDF